MKKLLCLLLAVVMLLGLCACGGSEGTTGNEAAGEQQETEKQLQIGYGKVNITPSYSVGLASSGDEKNRRSTGLISYLFATCVAMKYGEETYLMYTIDTIGISEEFGDILRVEILTEFPDLKLENIYLAATHTHSAPATGWSAVFLNQLNGFCNGLVLCRCCFLRRKCFYVFTFLPHTGNDHR